GPPLLLDKAEDWVGLIAAHVVTSTIAGNVDKAVAKKSKLKMTRAADAQWAPLDAAGAEVTVDLAVDVIDACPLSKIDIGVDPVTVEVKIELAAEDTFHVAGTTAWDLV